MLMSKKIEKKTIIYNRNRDTTINYFRLDTKQKITINFSIYF